MGAHDWRLYGAAAVVGLVAAVLWWLCSPSRQSVEMRELLVGVNIQEVFEYLRDPTNLKNIHPYTTGIEIQSNKTEGDETCIVFQWKEKLFGIIPAQTEASMTYKPNQFSISIDISTPKPGDSKVHIEWELEDAAGAKDSQEAKDPADESSLDGQSTDGVKQDKSHASKPCIGGTSNGRPAQEPSSPTADTQSEVPEKRTEMQDITHSQSGSSASPRTIQFKTTLAGEGPRYFLLIFFSIVNVPKAQKQLMEKTNEILAKKTVKNQ